MSVARFCDRCGKVVSSEEIRKSNSEVVITISPGTRDPRGSYDTDELCKKCVKKFFKWWNK